MLPSSLGCINSFKQRNTVSVRASSNMKSSPLEYVRVIVGLRCPQEQLHMFSSSKLAGAGPPSGFST